MRRTKQVLAIMAFTTLVGCSSPALPASTPTSATIALRLYATTATAALIEDLANSYSQLNPNITFETKIGDYRRMIDRLTNEEMPYFLSSHLPIDNPLWAAPIGQDGIAIVINPLNPVAGLSIAQIRSIYQGYITNWHEVGGPDQDIVVISRESGSGTRAEFEHLVMGTRRTTQAARLVPSSQAMVKSVGQLPGSIGYVSASLLDHSILALAVDGTLPALANIADNTYPLRSTLFFIGRGEPEDEYRVFIGWVQSPTGQTVVAQHYAPLVETP